MRFQRRTNINQPVVVPNGLQTQQLIDSNQSRPHESDLDRSERVRQLHQPDNSQPQQQPVDFPPRITIRQFVIAQDIVFEQQSNHERVRVGVRRRRSTRDLVAKRQQHIFAQLVHFLLGAQSKSSPVAVQSVDVCASAHTSRFEKSHVSQSQQQLDWFDQLANVHQPVQADHARFVVEFVENFAGDCVCESVWTQVFATTTQPVEGRRHGAVQWTSKHRHDRYERQQYYRYRSQHVQWTHEFESGRFEEQSAHDV